MGVITMDNQPISATFFKEGRWLTEFVTPDAMEIQELYRELTKDYPDRVARIRVIHEWVSREIKYKPYIKARLWVEGQSSSNADVWLPPSITRRIKVGNCANTSFLLASLLRNELDPGEVHVVLGNLHNGKAGGHAWVQVKLEDQAYIVESTCPDLPALVQAAVATRYEPVHYFNDQTAYAIEGKTVLEPFSRVYSTFLKEYLNWAYINGGR
ncbi:MAG TPA: hypothetical protein ENH69_02800 [Candidatus Aerophobetes bacterium]|uniref:Transglutaminase-like domain-containing protein n=1 Tax=Aerophobetes bacterium TaxID=2030807 RepID=A0A7C1MCU9_UNCAE|nr:hypothetical protein [Candidatus Aerophobetes bacterium]